MPLQKLVRLARRFERPRISGKNKEITERRLRSENLLVSRTATNIKSDQDSAGGVGAQIERTTQMVPCDTQDLAGVKGAFDSEGPVAVGFLLSGPASFFLVFNLRVHSLKAFLDENDYYSVDASN